MCSRPHVTQPPRGLADGRRQGQREQPVPHGVARVVHDGRAQQLAAAAQLAVCRQAVGGGGGGGGRGCGAAGAAVRRGAAGRRGWRDVAAAQDDHAQQAAGAAGLSARWRCEARAKRALMWKSALRASRLPAGLGASGSACGPPASAQPSRAQPAPPTPTLPHPHTSPPRPAPRAPAAHPLDVPVCVQPLQVEEPPVGLDHAAADYAQQQRPQRADDARQLAGKAADAQRPRGDVELGLAGKGLGRARAAAVVVVVVRRGPQRTRALRKHASNQQGAAVLT
jgi:hypothetical protein